VNKNDNSVSTTTNPNVGATISMWDDVTGSGASPDDETREMAKQRPFSSIELFVPYHNFMKR
jgi:hypothetical protein